MVRAGTRHEAAFVVTGMAGAGLSKMQKYKKEHKKKVGR